ncbi:flagellar biosynthesis regulator FlaF [Salaquimonas pukyongi]|uniref:flagellar biosynthesis regulator FlaF n=1 Tax=Salaquimonas pukyongi TaxID=2712698 RepID=UPI00096B8590|nr:flagellar biosynthesis regulator FlaF [Salaquimonas pukyongi]
MLNHAYMDTLEDDQQDARAREQEIFAEAIRLIDESIANPGNPAARATAIHHNVRMWSFFMEDLAQPDNDCSKEFKAGFISVGIFVLKHLQSMRSQADVEFGIVREVNETMLKGLGGPK